MHAISILPYYLFPICMFASFFPNSCMLCVVLVYIVSRLTQSIVSLSSSNKHKLCALLYFKLCFIPGLSSYILHLCVQSNWPKIASYDKRFIYTLPIESISLYSLLSFSALCNFVRHYCLNPSCLYMHSIPTYLQTVNFYSDRIQRQRTLTLRMCAWYSIFLSFSVYFHFIYFIYINFCIFTSYSVYLNKLIHFINFWFCDFWMSFLCNCLRLLLLYFTACLDLCNIFIAVWRFANKIRLNRLSGVRLQSNYKTMTRLSPCESYLPLRETNCPTN